MSVRPQSGDVKYFRGKDMMMVVAMLLAREHEPGNKIYVDASLTPYGSGKIEPCHYCTEPR